MHVSPCAREPRRSVQVIPDPSNPLQFCIIFNLLSSEHSCTQLSPFSFNCSVSPSFFLSSTIFLLYQPSVCPAISVRPSFHQLTQLSVCPSVHPISFSLLTLSIHPSIHPSISSFRLSCQSVCPSICLSIK